MKYILGSLFVSAISYAQPPLDQHVDHGAKETQKLLLDPARRAETFKDPKANQANQDLQKLTGGDIAIDQDIWALSSDLVPLLAGEGNGDEKKMLQMLEDFKRNPAGFANKFTPEQREKLKAISEKIQKGQKSNP